MPTIKDVAREAGVSIATVSYVLNNKRALVSEDTRRQVLETIERIGYAPNITARNLKASRTRLIGYGWHNEPDGQVNPVLGRFTYFLAQAAEAAGYHLLTFTHPPADPLHAYNELIRTQRVDAFVLAETVFQDSRIRFLMDSGFPFAAFGRSNPDWDFNWVDTDGAAGMHLAVQHLVSLGHARIGMVAWPEYSISGEHRVAGYRLGLREAGLPERDDYLMRGENQESSGCWALRHWWSLPPAQRPTAIIAVTDLVAIGVINEAQRLGLVVGRDLAVIGCDDAPMSQYLHPALTTIQQPIAEICKVLTQMVDALRLDSEEPTRQELIAPLLVIRESCGAAAAQRAG